MNGIPLVYAAFFDSHTPLAGRSPFRIHLPFWLWRQCSGTENYHGSNTAGRNQCHPHSHL